MTEERPTQEQTQGALEILRPVEQPMIPEGRPGALPESAYNGIASAAFTPEQIAILTAPVDPAHVSWKPSMNDGPWSPEEWALAKGKRNGAGKLWRPPLAYVEQVQYRRRLNAAFGPGGWGLRLLSPPKIDGKTVMFHGGLYVLGRFVAEAFGEQDYHESNYHQSWATALESAKSDALTRCCKDIGMFSELWEGKYLEGLLNVTPKTEARQEPRQPEPEAPPKPPKHPAPPEQEPAKQLGGWIPPVEWFQYLDQIMPMAKDLVLDKRGKPTDPTRVAQMLSSPKHRNPTTWWNTTKKYMDALGPDCPEPPACVKSAGIGALD